MVQGQRSEITLTVDSQADGFSGTGIQVGVVCHAGIVAGVHAENLEDGVLWSTEDLGVVIVPDVLTGWVGLGLTQQRDSLSLQC